MRKLLFLVCSIFLFNNGFAQKSIGKYNDKGQKTGEWKEYYDYKSAGKWVYIQNYKDGKLDGISKGYYDNENGNLSHIVKYENGLREGEYKSYWNNGQLESIGEYKHDHKYGEWKEYHENGKLQKIGSYDINGREIGIWKSYNIKGEFLRESEYRYGSKAFADFVFRETGLGYDEEKKELLTPEDSKLIIPCSKRTKPNHYACIGGGGGPSFNFIDKGEKPGDFKVSIFHPLEKSGTSSVSISTFVEDGKVIQQSRCFYKRQYNYYSNENESKGHYFLAKMECYVVTPKMIDLFNSIQSQEDFKSEEKYKEFVNLLKSDEYKEQLLEAHKYNFRNAFLKLNREQNFDYYSKLKYGFYKENMKYKDYKKSINIVNFEETDAVKNSKNFSELVSKAKDLMLKVYINPAADLTENNLIAKPNK